MADIFSLNDAFSTTRKLTKTRPEFEGVLLCPEHILQGGLRTKGFFKHRETDIPLITIVTVVYNGDEFLEKTIKSVINQTHVNVEYIVIDGGSTDGTLEVIRKYEQQIDYWISEKDDGVYDAMNKAQRLASGVFLNFMNAGDVFYKKDIISNVSEHVSESISVIYGDSVVSNGSQHITVKAKNMSTLNLLLWSTRTVCHQACFVRKSIMPRYNTDFVLKAELDWYFEILVRNPRTIHLSTPFCVYLLGGLSDRLFKLEMTETIKVMFRRHPFKTFLHVPIFIYKLIRRIFR